MVLNAVEIPFFTVFTTVMIVVLMPFGRIRPRSGSDGAADRGTSGHGVQKSPAGLGAPQQAFLQSKNRKCIDTCPACQECVPS